MKRLILGSVVSAAVLASAVVQPVYSADASTCTDPAFIKRITASENKRLKPMGGSVKSVEFSSFEEGSCWYEFTHKDGLTATMIVKLLKNGGFKISGME
jgi:hypothetical protein